MKNFKNYLFMVTGVLFAIHLGLYIMAMVTGASIAILPFLYVPSVGAFQLLLYLPAALIFDFLLACIVLFVLNKYKKDIKLSWIDKIVEMAERGKTKPNKIGLLIKIAAFIGLIVLVKFNGVIFANIPGIQVIQLTDNLTNIIIALFSIGIVFDIIRLFSGSDIVEICESCAVLICLWLVVREPFQSVLANIENGITEGTFIAIKGVFVLIIFFVTFDLVKSIIRLGARMGSKES